MIRNVESKGLGTRYYLWENSLNLFKKNPFFGNGISSKLNTTFNEFTINFNKVTHNSFLDLLTWVGIFGTIIYYRLIYYCFDIKDIMKNNLSFLIIVQIIAMFSLSWVYKDLFWVTLALCYIIKLEKNENITC